MTRTSVIVGAAWDDPLTYKVRTEFKANHFGEGAHLWLDRDETVVHFISHDGNLEGTTCGRHFSSPITDLRIWE
eukprot:CAMPEP_0206325660 /NCGR_PEP_ID=MMETSP0106_2-20121207/21193_1 /ASSEMBLY_ACC=CAM_ASM_000206 /TAXON_ID=81532 /ORGANISM="Acanthoeca-like sp., Strain 10tr" /LENGTH=73 /DNA_ID=CAMNT_0053758145 /DNA_START=111 /DNA_END=332 /DNA_ORIENTATION=+